MSGENKFSPWDEPKVWHVLYADSVTCDSSVPALEDVTFTMEMFNPDSEGKPTNHCGCDETGYLLVETKVYNTVKPQFSRLQLHPVSQFTF